VEARASWEFEVSPELSECIQTLRSVLENHIRLIDELIAVCIGHESATAIRQEQNQIDPVVSSALVPMLQAIGSSSNTLVWISNAPGLHTRDCYSIARSILEGCVNTCYIMAEGRDAANRALRHARQKSFRDLDRRSEVGESVIGLSFEPRPVPGPFASGPETDLETDVQEFTSRTGREKGWTDLSIDQRIAIAGGEAKDVLSSLHYARFMIYRHSSEILHGTLFGAMFFHGYTFPLRPKSLEGYFESIGAQHMQILMGTVLAVSAVLERFHRTYGFSTAYARSRALIREMDVLEPYLMGSESPPPPSPPATP
jgi:hypothetical protein